MTTTRYAIIGAVALNVPTIFTSTLLPAGALALSAVVLAATGAALGAMFGWGVSKPSDEITAATRSEPAAIERIAA